MIQQAVAGMKTVKDIGEKERKAEIMSTLMTILTVIFAVIPFVGEEAAAALQLANIARMIAIGGEIANAGLTAYEVSQDPSGAPLAIFGMLLGTRGLGRDSDDFSRVGGLRNEMSAADVAKLGKVFEDQTASINKIVRKCAA
jgi:hypothetical protein